MKRQKTKLAVALLALACAGVCVGAGAAYVVPSQANGVAAQAETTYTQFSVGKLAIKSGDATSVYFKPADSSVAFPIDSWEDPFSYVSGNGITVDGKMINMENSVKSPSGDFYVGLGQTVSTGAVLKIGGVLRCEKRNTDYVIEDCAFQWNGSAWVEYVNEYDVYNVGKLTVNTTTTPANNYLYLIKQNGSTVDDWTRYEYVSGAGFKVNGEEATLNALQNVGSGLYLAFEAVEEGDEISIEGTYVCNDTAIQYNIEESKFKWTGSGWEKVLVYKTHELGVIAPNVNSVSGGTASQNANQLYTYDANKLPVQDWGSAFVLESGYGVKINDETLSSFEIKSTDGGLWFGLSGVQKDDVISICGTFKNEDYQVKYVIEESKFTWNGSGWASYKEYTEHTITNLQVANTSMAGGAYVANNVLSLTMEGGATTSDWPWFVYESGAGFKVNGETASLTGNIANGVQDTNGGLYFQFAGVNKGDKVSIGGTFVNEDLGLKYVIEETAFIWKGTTWVSEKEDSIVYDTYEVGTLNFSQLYPNKNMADFARADGQDFVLKGEPGGDKLWNTAFSVREDSGVGVTVNGVMVNATVKFPLLMFVELPAVPNEDDVLVIGGTFYNAELAVEYVVTESTFIYDGAIWVNKLDIEKESAIDELREYRDSFVEDDYYEAEWDSLDTKVEEGAAAIKAAMTSEEIAAALEAAKAALDDVVTKAESDAIFNELKENSKTELESYKEEAAYRANEWAAIQEIIAEAKAAIDVAQSVTDIENAVNSAHTKMDAVKTDAQWTEAEGVIAAAKAELDGYVNAEDYRDVEWAKIEAIIADANTEIDAVPFDSEAIAQIVVNAKAAIDEVFTKVEAEAAEAVVSAAKAEIAEYKAQADYHDAEWAEIQAIITEANGKLDKAFGNDEAIAQIVADTKAAIDEVKTAAVVDAEALAAAKAAADEEALAFYGSLDFTKYTDQDIVIINGYVEAVRYEIEQATTQEEINTALAQFKAKVNGIETTVPPVVDSTDKDNYVDDDDDDYGGCGSVVTGGLSVGVAMAAAVVVAIRRKKED
ncbi:MAG: hypothetical protein IJD77_04015 [Clostridia bacterium]|nr:hypothetical protein [Clostridia bacterium]